MRSLIQWPFVTSEVGGVLLSPSWVYHIDSQCILPLFNLIQLPSLFLGTGLESETEPGCLQRRLESMRKAGWSRCRAAPENSVSRLAELDGNGEITNISMSPFLTCGSIFRSYGKFSRSSCFIISECAMSHSYYAKEPLNNQMVVWNMLLRHNMRSDDTWGYLYFL